MDKLVVYCLVDKVAGIASNPSVHMNDEDAQRYYSTVVCREGSIPAARPADFEWKKVGYFNRNTGEIKSYEC